MELETQLKTNSILTLTNAFVKFFAELFDKYKQGKCYSILMTYHITFDKSLIF